MDAQLIGIIGLIVAGLALLASLVYIGLHDRTDQDPLQKRLAEYGDRELPASLEELELSLSFGDRVLVPTLRGLANLAAKFTPESQLEGTRHSLELAGKSPGMDPTTFFGIRIVSTLAFGGLMFFLFVVLGAKLFNPFIAVIGGLLLGYFLPSMWLSSQISRRKQAIVKALPDALDLLTICVEAGLGFDAALGKVYEKWDNELSVAFGRVLQEIQLGKVRRESLRDMSNRMDVPDVGSFTAAIIQADQLGVSIAKILRIQSDQMRVKRRQRAQEKAQQAPVKMIVPMVFLIFPSIWIVLLGPSVIVLRESGIGQILG